jgi:hypothetical protein
VIRGEGTSAVSHSFAAPDRSVLLRACCCCRLEPTGTHTRQTRRRRPATATAGEATRTPPRLSRWPSPSGGTTEGSRSFERGAPVYARPRCTGHSVRRPLRCFSTEHIQVINHGDFELYLLVSNLETTRAAIA